MICNPKIQEIIDRLAYIEQVVRSLETVRTHFTRLLKADVSYLTALVSAQRTTVNSCTCELLMLQKEHKRLVARLRRSGINYSY